MLARMLSVMEVILALKAAPLFRDVPGEGLKRLSDFVQEKSVPAGELIFQEQDLGDEMYLVRRGRVRIEQLVGSKPVVVETVTTGGHFGEMAIIDDSPRTASAVADEDSSLLVLHKNDFRSAVQDYPDIAFEVFRELVRRLRDSDARFRKVAEEARRLGLETR